MKYELKKRLNTENILSMQVLKSKHLRVAAYARVSTSFDDQRQSVESQKKHYTKKILENSNWELVGIYCDDGVSGTSVNGRTGFQELLKDVGKGKIDLILTKSVSRFARNTYDTIKYVRILREQKVSHKLRKDEISWNKYGKKLEKMHYTYMPNKIILAMLLFFVLIIGISP